MLAAAVKLETWMERRNWKKGLNCALNTINLLYF
jgi:hypothetical protein